MPEVMADAPGTTTSGLFMPEVFTPLYYTSLYEQLDDEERRSYTLFHLLYFHEQLGFFESTLPETLLRSLLRDDRFAHLHEQIREFIDEEKQHEAMFRELNRRLAPELYARRDRFFLVIPMGWRTAWEWAASWAPMRGAFLWTMLVQEERALTYTRGFLASADLTAEVRETHQRHLDEEVHHHRNDEELLDLVRAQSHSRWRRSSARCFSWMLRHLFLAPRRGGWRVVEHWLTQHPRLGRHRSSLRRELRALDHHPAYVRMMYGRDVIPRSWQLMESCAEMQPLLRFLERRTNGGAGSAGVSRQEVRKTR